MISSAIAEQPLGADEQAGQVGPGRLEAVAAEPHHLAVGQHGLEAEHVVGRHPVPEAVRAAGVERDVAADGADRLARRIGRVVQAVRSRPPRVTSRLIDAGLDHGDARRPGRSRRMRFSRLSAMTMPSSIGTSPAGQAGAAAAGHERHAGGVAEPDDLDDFVAGFRQHDGARAGAEGGEPVALVWGQAARRR